MIIERESKLYRVLEQAARERRCVFVTGLPGVGKSLVVQQLGFLATDFGRPVDLLQWDVARLPFDKPHILARYPEVDGVTHAAIRIAVGLWARRAVREWDRTHQDPGHLLVGETPLIGNRLLELARPANDEVEPLLAEERTLFLIPVPTSAVRAVIEAARGRDTSEPQHERDTASAAPHLVRSHWKELAEVARKIGIPAPRSDAYDESLYAAVYQHVLTHRHSIVLPMTDVLRVRTSANVVPPTTRELVPTATEVDQFIATVGARPLVEVEREAARWYEV